MALCGLPDLRRVARFVTKGVLFSSLLKHTINTYTDTSSTFTYHHSFADGGEPERRHVAVAGSKPRLDGLSKSLGQEVLPLVACSFCARQTQAFIYCPRINTISDVSTPDIPRRPLARQVDDALKCKESSRCVRYALTLWISIEQADRLLLTSSGLGNGEKEVSLACDAHIYIYMCVCVNTCH